jgi:hypothetical protein
MTTVHTSILIAASRGSPQGLFEAEITGTIASWSPQRRLWFNAAGCGFIVRGERGRYSGALGLKLGRIPMSVQMVLLPVFVLVGLAFALLLWMAGARRQALVDGQTKVRDIALGQSNWPTRATQIGNCFANQFELPLLFYILIALALPLRHADLFIVLMSWVFVVTRFVHAGIFVSSNDLKQRSLVWFAGVLVLFAMWIYFALRILLLI